MSSVAKNVKLMGENIRPGQKLTEALSSQRMNAIMDAIRGLLRGDNISGPGLRKRQTSDGVVLTVTAEGGGRSSRLPAPFDITISGTKATFRAGTVNNVLPTNYLTGVTVPTTGTRYLILTVTTSSGQATSAVFSASSTAPTAIAPAAGIPPSTFTVLIGVLIDGTAVKVWGDGNIQALPVESFRVDKATPVAGALPYTIYYTWELSLIA